MVCDEAFECRHTAAGTQVEPPDLPRPIVPFKLRFASEVTQRVYDDFNDDLVSWNPDGSCLVTVGLVEDEWVYGFLLSYGCFVEVLEPVHVRGILAERMRWALRQYNGDHGSHDTLCHMISARIKCKLRDG
jgi:predicted DNA-binding transcriptional regulator YafY